MRKRYLNVVFSARNSKEKKEYSKQDNKPGGSAEKGKDLHKTLSEKTSSIAEGFFLN
jgi:hypothetical protein